MTATGTTEEREKVLVVGGAGYVGSHMVKALLEAGMEPVTFDNLSSGHRDAVLGGNFVEGDLADRAALAALFAAHRFSAAMLFAGSIQVGESVINPALYYRNNVANAVNLLDAAVAAGVRRLVFSSTAAVYGEPQRVPIDEAHPLQPVNPYGRSKLMVEQILADYDRAYGLKSACLRYFNAAGADPQGRLGERHDPETHLIPLAIDAVLGKRPGLAVFGDDYDTPDGTCIRDYVHVDDLCRAHLLALAALRRDGQSLALNLGIGRGYSVREVIDAVGRVAGRAVPVRIEARRAGDPARLVADGTRARELLGWQPAYAELHAIVEHAWRWANGRA